MRKTIFLLIFIFLSIIVSAKLLTLSLTPYMSFPLSSFDDDAQNGMGINAALFIHPLKFFDIYTGIGFEKWDSDNNSNFVSINYSNIPVFAGFRLYPMQLYGLPAVPGKFFISLSPSINIYKITTITNVLGNESTSTNEDNCFGFSIGMGYVIYLKTMGFALSGEYKYINTSGTDVNTLNLGLSILFKLL